MTLYLYNALKNNKIIVTGRVEAANEADARKKIKDMNLVPTSVVDSEIKQKRIKKAKIDSLSLKEKIDFTSTLEILTSTGIPIVESLLFLEQNSDSKKVSHMTHEFRKQIIGGLTLGETLERYRDVFGKVYVGLVKAGEDSGELDKTLSRMMELLKKQGAIKSKIIGALVYPSVVVLLAFAVVILMLVLVFPAFAEMFSSAGKELPPLTQFFLDAGLFMRDYWVVCIIAAVSAVFGVMHLYKMNTVRRAVDSFILHIPVISGMFKFSNFSNFMAVLLVSYEAGIPIVDCLFLANMTMENQVLQSAIRKAATKVQQGVHLSSALKNVKEVPNMMTFMIATGEQSGRLGDSLNYCVTYIDKKLDDLIDAFTKLIEPALMIFVGALVGTVALAFYIPLFQIYQQ